MAYSREFKPLVIRAFLRTGVVCDKWLPLDGILFSQAMRDTYGAQDATLPGGNAAKGAEKVHVPLAVVRRGESDWYYACSWAQWPTHAIEGIDHWNKRFDNQFADYIGFGKRRGKVLVEEGQYKAYHMPIFYRAALWAEWYAVGDRKRIQELLSTTTNIGKKGSQGWGRVIAWEVEEAPEDWSVWRNGRLTRGVPARDVIDAPKPFDLTRYGYRPSYYRPENQTLVAMPDAQ